jgi:Surface lipoprotein
MSQAAWGSSERMRISRNLAIWGVGSGPYFGVANLGPSDVRGVDPVEWPIVH